MALPIMEVTAMMNDETRRKLLEMGMQEILDAIDMQNKDIDCTVLGFDERMQMIVDYAYQEKFNQRVKRLIKQAKFRLDGDINSIYYSERGFRREDLHSIASCGFIKENRSVIIHRPTGSGKTYLGCALGKMACRQKIRTRYIRMPDLLMEYEEQSIIQNGKQKVLKKYSGYELLILDEWLFEDITESSIQFIFELIERRYDNTSTIFCTQYPKKDWHARLGGGVHADSIMDRIVHNAIWLFAGTKNMREWIAKADID